MCAVTRVYVLLQALEKSCPEVEKVPSVGLASGFRCPDTYVALI